MHIRNAVILLAPALLSAQLTTNTVSVTASNSSTQQPDQAVFSVTANSGIDKNLSDIVSALSGSGITAGNLAGINSPSPSPFQAQQQPALQWGFQLTVPIAKVKDTAASLAALQKTIGQANSGLTLSFYIQQTEVSAQSRTCDLAGLVNNGHTQAQKMAGPAGLSAGRIVGITNSTSDGVSVCSLNVKFALGGMIGQPGPNAISITSARSTNTALDQAVIGIYVISGMTTSLDDIGAALTKAGITGATFTGVSTSTIFVANGDQTELQNVLSWSFNLTTVPLANLKSALTPLAAAQQTFIQQNPDLALSITVASTQSSSQACSQSDLMSDARTQAQKVAVAGGVTAGPVLSISDSGVSNVISAPIWPDFFNSWLIRAVLSTPLPSCALTVQFQLQ